MVEFYCWKGLNSAASKSVSSTGLNYIVFRGASGKGRVLSYETNGGQITASWNGQQIVTWTDTSPWARGKVGFRQCVSRNVQWDNFYAYSKSEIDGYNDYYPYGSIMPGRSSVQSADDRYKFTSKERDTETGYDYFGARYYDSWLGRWLQVDPLADKYPGWSPFNYAKNDPLRFTDPDGKGIKDDKLKKAFQEHHNNLVALKKSIKEGDIGGILKNGFKTIVSGFEKVSLTVGGMPSPAAIEVTTTNVVSQGSSFIATEKGEVIPVPKNWETRVANNGKGSCNPIT